ncbi:unnamed protein product [Rhizoctonia solani]|uniref:Fungal-type protein kinase domain-containing protein n=1 Tax=Rhizoctonia solani TaxID=456999 RepID=A0A8H2WR80_9AGAM|nr:unnamed protein product [Rhizoctonia solani]
MSIHLTSSSSPIKAGGPPCESRTASEAQKDARGLNLVTEVSWEDFVQGYLSSGSCELFSQWEEDQMRLVEQIKEVPSGQEKTLYQSQGDAPLLSLLNSVSKRVSQSRGGSKTQTLVFHSYDAHPIENVYPGPDQKPDLIVSWSDSHVLEGSSVSNSTSNSSTPSKRPTWLDVVAVGEVKLRNTRHYQLANYVRHLLRHHPELNAVLGFAVQPKGYQLVYHDARVIHRSTRVEWSPGPIHALVDRLYDSPFRDGSMAVLVSETGSPSWATKIGEDVMISQYTHSSLGPGQRRFTNLAVDLKSGISMSLFIKDIWRDERRRFYEALLYEMAHRAQNLAGLMTISHHGYVQDEVGRPIRTTSLGSESGTRYKMRIATKDIGRPLDNIQTLREFLCVMYDACVVQRNLYRKCRILHRDISDGNIMLAPNTPGYSEISAAGYADVKFVNQILAHNVDAKPNPTCLLVDLGNGADLKIPSGQGALAERTGTPKFIARSVSSGRVLDFGTHRTDFARMPKLRGRSRELYESAYGTSYEEPYSTIDDGPWPTNEPLVDFKHQLFHDAESTFWVIAWTLVRSARKGYQPEKDWNSDFKTFISTMKNHYPSPDTQDNRLFPESEAVWRSYLHGDLADLAPMLCQMYAYIRPEWAFRPKLHAEHVHEAIMRLLLIEIVRIDDDNANIPLAVGIRSLPRMQADRRSTHQSWSTSGLSTGISHLQSRTRSSLEPPLYVPRENVASENVVLGRKRSGSHLDEQADHRRSPVFTPTELKSDTNFVEWAKPKVQEIRWGDFGTLLKPEQGKAGANKGEE